MLTSLWLHNFKSFHKPSPLALGRVALFCGSNSSGKSSLIQALLVLKQTLESPSPDDPLILNGSWVGLGEFEDVHHYDSDSREPIRIGVCTSLGTTDEAEEWTGRLRAGIRPLWSRRPIYGRSLYVRQPYDMSVEVDVSRGAPRSIWNLSSTKLRINSQSGWLQPLELVIEQAPHVLEALRAKHELAGFDRRVFDTALYAITKCEPPPTLPDAAPVACSLHNFLPSWWLVPDDTMANRLIDEFLDAAKPYLASAMGEQSNVVELEKLRRNRLERRNSKARTGVDSAPDEDTLMARLERFLAELPDILRVLKEAVPENVFNEWDQRFQEARRRPRLVPERPQLVLHADERTGYRFLLDTALDEFRQFFASGLFYLGPLRDEPRAFYRRLGSSDPTYVGQRGENTAFVLKYHGAKEIACVEPPDPDIDWNPMSGEVRIRTLAAAVNRWLRYLRLAKNIRVDELGKIGLAIRANIDGGKHDSDLPNVGVGVSQVLPLIVLGLAAPPGSTLLLEQPELHLHPYVQSRLADFFLALTRTGKQVIAETHSEHLMNRMRFHIAKRHISPKEDLSLYFCEKKEGSAASKVSPRSGGKIRAD